MGRFRTSQLREHWSDWQCKDAAMTAIDFGPDRILVALPTADAWAALARVLAHHGYSIRTADTDSYNCRAITGGTGLSLHAFGIALDVNWETNPFLETPDRRQVRFSRRRSQEARGQDVRAGEADTDMTEAMIAHVRAIETVEGLSAFEWGGDWNTIRDAMHFQLDVTPAELERGIDWNTVAGEPAVAKADPLFPRKGEVGPVVEYFQRRLARLSSTSPGTIDGWYGDKTAASVVAFQKSRAPKIEEGRAGEWIGPWTRGELDLAEAERAAAG